MTIRALRESDLPTLRAFAERSGYPYPDPTGQHIEMVLVVADENDRPLMACAAERIVQLYLWADADQHPAAKFAAIAALHKYMRPLLKRRGYTEVNAFVPPELEKQFGGRLARTFGWMRNWGSLFLKL